MATAKSISRCFRSTGYGIISTSRRIFSGLCGKPPTPDLAWAMKYNPNLKVQLNAGNFDLSTPFYEGIYEMRHLPMPTKLQANCDGPRRCLAVHRGSAAHSHPIGGILA